MPSTASAGIWMLPALGLLVLGTGLPVWVLLIGTASVFAAAGMVFGVMDIQVLGAVSARTLGLLEHDLLQALPLYVLVGVLLQRLHIADSLFGALARLFHRTGAGPSIAAFGVGAIVAPMIGSVASSAALLTRLIAPRLTTEPPARSIALIAVTSTLGVVVPPSLVLILLGDALLRAHTEAGNLMGNGSGFVRIINTQDVFHAAMVPAALVGLLWLAIAVWRGRRSARQAQPATVPTVSRREAVLAMLAVAATATMLGGVYSGLLLAVEAAATLAMVLVVSALLSGTLSREAWRAVLADSLSLSGALLALLVGATTFSLVFRLWGTDRWLTSLVLDSSLAPLAAGALTLAAVALCAWLLDAFEMIFVIIPIAAPALILSLGDAQQTAVLLLLVLQLSFVVPPMGYAVLMARNQGAGSGVTTTQLAAQLWPYLLAQCAVVILVFAAPQLVHLLDAAAPAAVPAALTPADLDQQMREMAEQTGTTKP